MKKILLVLCILCVFASRSKCQVNQTDSLALVDLYNYTNGPNWFNNTNWLTGPVSTWYGIVLNPGGNSVKVIALPLNNLIEELPNSIGDFIALDSIELMGNNLSGTIPSELGNLHTLYYLNLTDNNFSGIIQWDSGYLPILNRIYLYNNNLSGSFPSTVMNNILHIVGISYNHFNSIPDYSSQTQLGGGLYIDHNNLDFASLEPNSSLFQVGGYYLFQDSVLTSMDTIVIQGSELVLHSKVGGASNMYLWTKNDNPLWGQIDTNLVLSNITFADSGWYSCTINNVVVNDLTLNRKKIHVHVVDSITAMLPALSKEESLKINWNNTEKLLTINLEFIAGSQLQAAVYNLQGQKVKDLFRGKMKFKEYHYRLDFLTPGLYFVKINTGNHVLTKKFVVN